MMWGDGGGDKFWWFFGSAFVAAAPSSGPDGPPSPRGGEEWCGVCFGTAPLIPLPVGERLASARKSLRWSDFSEQGPVGLDRAQPETGEGDGWQGACFPRQRLPAPPPSFARPYGQAALPPPSRGRWGAVFGAAPRHSRVALMAFSPQISPPERFALRDG